MLRRLWLLLSPPLGAAGARAFDATDHGGRPAAYAPSRACFADGAAGQRGPQSMGEPSIFSNERRHLASGPGPPRDLRQI